MPETLARRCRRRDRDMIGESDTPKASIVPLPPMPHRLARARIYLSLTSSKTLTIWSYMCSSSPLVTEISVEGASHLYDWKLSSWRRMLNWEESRQPLTPSQTTEPRALAAALR